MRKKKYFVSLASFAIVALLALSFVAVTGYVADREKPELTTSFRGGVSQVTGPGRPGFQAKDPIIWDNGLPTSSLNYYSSQNDAQYPFVSQVADDFMFADDMNVTDVHWWGGFWNGPPDEVEPCPFYIYFYADDGTGNAPTGAGMADPSPTALASYYFAGVSGLPLDPNGHYEYNVDLSPPFSAAAGVKYWIAIQADFPYPPQWGNTNTAGIQLHSATQGFPFLGMAFWTDVDPAADMAFYLTGVPSGPPWPNHKMHFPQLPDLEGWDVNATDPKTLADDWQCSRTGPVEDIHFWGSWKDLDGDPLTDDFFTPMPWFRLSIHRNIPADPDTPWSRPGDLLWFWEGEIPGVPSEPPSLEGWIDPNTGEVLYNDHIPYWRYDFVDIPEPFYQYEDSIYWLDISALYIQPPYQWGWKNSRDHFMDDATYTDNAPVGPWYPIIEPPRYNEFFVEFSTDGVPVNWDGTNFYGEGFYQYEYWWNMWFYDNPFTYDHPKVGVIEFIVDPIGPSPWLEFAINWSTDLWSLEGVPDRPPLPGEDETLYIGRQIIGPLEPMGSYSFPIDIPYNPEWISVDFMARDVVIVGNTFHECVGTSLDLAFVITGPECTPSIDVEKKVWDENLQDWVDSVDVNVCNNVDFLITILNDGTCDLTNIIAEDFMDSSLEFVNASPYPDIINPVPGGTYLEWNFPDPFSPGSTIEINLTAHVVGPACHLDSNYVFVHGSYEPQAIEVYDEDAAYVHATEEPWPNHKMHFPQLPNPEGWDVVATMGYDMHPGIVTADDFMCTESGRITDIHLWGSWLYDMEMPIQGFFLSIHDNIPGPPYSMPGAELWSAHVTDFEVVPEGQGMQGWYDPFAPWWEYPNHQLYFRYDITNIPEPFCQDSGTIYWLNVMADIGPPGYMGFPFPEPPLWGWKTSLEHYEDDAVWAVWTPPVYDWIPLEDPNTGMTLDLSFVITGEEALCGDVNHNGAADAGDVVYLISYLFRGGPAPCPLLLGDVNCTGAVDAGDVVYLISYLFRGGPPPCDPNNDGIPDC
jgi:uncharacterized repeat protein (TIGR01451 family)